MSYCDVILLFLFFFFFQAEDGIRDGHVTGVQTCALPICIVETWAADRRVAVASNSSVGSPRLDDAAPLVHTVEPFAETRSEERRVGKECRSRWSADD